MKDNCIVAQSGGPTVAINASLAGVIDGVKKSNKFRNITLEKVTPSKGNYSSPIKDEKIPETHPTDHHSTHQKRKKQSFFKITRH